MGRIFVSGRSRRRRHWLRAGGWIASRPGGDAVTGGAPDRGSRIEACCQHVAYAKGHAIAASETANAARAAAVEGSGADAGADPEAAADWPGDDTIAGWPAAVTISDCAEADAHADTDGATAGSVSDAGADCPAANDGTVVEAEPSALNRPARPGVDDPAKFTPPGSARSSS